MRKAVTSTSSHQNIFIYQNYIRSDVLVRKNEIIRTVLIFPNQNFNESEVKQDLFGTNIEKQSTIYLILTFTNILKLIQFVP